MTPAPRRLQAAAVVAAALPGAGAGTAVADASLITVVDNSHADPVLEIDRTADVQQGSGATAAATTTAAPST
ncbi:hypothetical protein ACFW91_09600 [Streptomyces asoensis]|uniref:hypothetical protein n=1 Tax=Streptomyces asoensis TaxID=249586 RepID=UPI0036891A91